MQEMQVRPLDPEDPLGGNDNPLQYSCLEKPMDRGAWWATVHGVPKESDQHTHMYGKIQEFGLIEIFPLICISAIQNAVHSHPASPQGHHQGWLQWLTARWRASCLQPELLQGLASRWL